MTDTAKPIVLFADDYPDALDVWTLYLSAAGFTVLTASDGPGALAETERATPDVIVLDLEMPGLSGYEVARELRARPATQSTPLIAATGHSHARQLDEALTCGFDAVIVKPCDPGALVAEIRRLLARPAQA